MVYILLILGFALLVYGADFFVSGASSIAKKMNISNLVIGLTVVAFGTSAPELSVSTLAALNGQNSIAISNVLGSNIFNILVVLGICALIVPINVEPSILKKEIPIAVASSLLLFILLSDALITGSQNLLSRFDGIILLIGFISFMVFVLKSAKNPTNQNTAEEVVEISTPKSIFKVVLGLFAVVFGGDLVVDNATIIALSFGVSETIIGLTIVAIGTSLPELVTSVVACRKGNSDMAIGNVIGSNIFNILMILGLSSIISPLAIEDVAIIDSLILIVFTVIALLMGTTKNKISRIEGLILICCFIGYNFYIFNR
ncbi:MAG: calcium/sodium antiporter [Lachnospirales bacterium]